MKKNVFVTSAVLSSNKTKNKLSMYAYYSNKIYLNKD